MIERSTYPSKGKHGSRGRQCLAAGLTLLLAVALAACGGGESSSSGTGGGASSASDGGGGGDINARLYFPPTTLDPQAASDISSIALAAYAYDNIVALRDGKIVPQIASDWKVTPTSAELTIDPKVKCADGSDLTAKDVADSINRMRDPNVEATRAPSLFGSQDGYEATANPKDETVQVELDEPFGDLEFGLSQVFVLCRAGLAAKPEELQSKTFGSGPYVLANQVSGSSYSYDQHQGYDWGPDEASLEGDVPSGIEFQVIPNETTATNQFLTGALDLTMGSVDSERKRLDASDQVTEKAVVASDTYGIRLNQHAGRPTANPDIRRMLSAATDRAALAQAHLGVGARVPETLVLPNGICYQPDAVSDAIIGYDLEDAEKYAAAAGYTLEGDKLVNEDGEQLKLKVMVPDIFVPAIGEFLESAWGEIGIDVQAEFLPIAKALERAFTPGGDWDMFVEGAGGGESPSSLIKTFTPENYTGVKNPEFEKLIGEAKTQLTKDDCDVWAEAERSLYKQANVIPYAVADAAWYGHDVTFVPWKLTAVFPDSLRWSK